MERRSGKSGFKKWCFLAAIVLVVVWFFQPLVSFYCVCTDTPRSAFKYSSAMRSPIRSLFLKWESTEGIVETKEALSLIALIQNELPRGSTLEDVREHIRLHYRSGAEMSEGNRLRSGEEGYLFPSLEVIKIRACWNPRELMNFAVEVNYVALEGRYLGTEIRLVGAKGSVVGEVIEVVAEKKPQ